MIFIVLVPLVVFAIFEAWGSLKSALIAATLTAVGECLFTYYYFGELDSFSVASILLVVVMAGLAYYKDSRKIFYLKPAILSFIFGIFLLGSYVLGYYVIYDGVIKYSILLTPEQQIVLLDASVESTLKLAGLTVGIAFMIHGFISWYAALKLSRTWWLLIAGLGIYPFLLFGVLAARFLV